MSWKISFPQRTYSSHSKRFAALKTNARLWIFVVSWMRSVTLGAEGDFLLSRSAPGFLRRHPEASRGPFLSSPPSLAPLSAGFLATRFGFVYVTGMEASSYRLLLLVLALYRTALQEPCALADGCSRYMAIPRCILALWNPLSLLPSSQKENKNKKEGVQVTLRFYFRFRRFFF